MITPNMFENVIAVLKIIHSIQSRPLFSKIKLSNNLGKRLPEGFFSSIVVLCSLPGSEG